MARRSAPSTTIEISLPALRPRASATDAVYDTLREAILTCELPGGTPLIEAALAAQFGVSKTPVREALHRLAHSGLVDMELARGATVHTLTPVEIRDISELRAELEPLALRQSIPHFTTSDFQQMRQVLVEAKQSLVAHDYQKLSSLNNSFHHALTHRATNHLLIKWLESLSDRRRLISMQGWSIDNRSLREWDEHSAILDALETGDGEAAVQRLRDHILRFSQIVTEQPLTEMPVPI
ncbi:MAG: GntR family transcriptional regulator [Chloroflexi bacterium]|nr:GntR family transcriptional regulator [Chloroflexota bacterium]MCC6896629.1 GntR family transcriptional regulator [Anaerolineae bacterium]